MRIIVTGAAGYVGSVLAPMLAAEGHEVLAVDIDSIRLEQARARTDGVRPSVHWARAGLDELAMDRHLLAQTEAIVHLAGVSSDAAAEHDPVATRRINLDLTLHLAHAAKAAGVRRFFLASTVAIYQVPVGHRLEHELFREGDAPPLGEPLGAYARTKLAAEQALFELADADFATSVLRKGSLYGYAPIMRWDLMINRVVLAAWKGEPLLLHDFGAVWRPIAHVQDAARAYAHLLRLPPWTSTGLAFNLVERNVRISEILLEVDNTLASEHGRRIVLDYGRSPLGQRTGRASGELLRRTGWRPLLTVAQGVADLFWRLEHAEVAPVEEFEERSPATVPVPETS